MYTFSDAALKHNNERRTATTHKRRRRFAFALVMCLLFGLLPGVSRAEETQALPVADAPAAETPESAVPATQTPTETFEAIEAETVFLSEDKVRVIKGQTTTLTAKIPEAQRGESPLSTSSGIVWTSSNPEVATVDSNGVVTGIELGEATITATLTFIMGMCPDFAIRASANSHNC